MSVAKSHKTASTSHAGNSSEKVVASEHSLSDLVVMLDSTSLDSLRLALVELNRKTAVYRSDERIGPSDARIQTALELVSLGGVTSDTSSMNASKGIWHAWEVANSQKQSGLLPLVLHLLANLINVLGAHQPNHEQAEKIIHSLISTPDSVHGQRSWNDLQTYLSETGGAKPKGSGKDRIKGTSTDDLISATLRLLLAITSFAGAKYARNVFDNMAWGMKSLSKLLNMRRRNATKKRDNKSTPVVRGLSTATLDRPDIRTLWIMFLLSFLRSPSGGCTAVSLRIAALSLGKDMYSAIMKGLTKDPAQIVAFILMGLHDGLLSDEASAKLPRGRVVSLFNEWTCKELVAMYERENDTIKLVQSEEEHSIADVVHHFLLALCTHPGRGVCYIDNGWYGRMNDKTNIDDDGSIEATEGTNEDAGQVTRLSIYNKVLLGVLRSLTPYRSPKQGELAIRILKAAPELSGPYFITLTNIIDPKPLSISWLSSSTFLGRALSLPLPTFQSKSGKWHSLPPSKRACTEALLPTCLSKAMFSRGIAMQDRLSRYATITLLIRTLSRLLLFRDVCFSANEGSAQIQQGTDIDIHQDAEEAVLRGEVGLQANTQTPWIAIWEEVAISSQECLPDLTQLIHSLDAFQKNVGNEKVEKEGEASSANNATLLESTLKACWLLLEVTPSSEHVSTADLDKLFQFSLSDVKDDQDDSSGLVSLSKLHAMRAVATRAFENGQGEFNIFARTSSSLAGTSSSASSLSRLLHIANSSSLPMLRSTSLALISSAMKASVMFEHDSAEWQAWQYALDGQDCHLYDFIDECAQRCIKVPYKYIEMAREAVLKQNGSEESMTDIAFSPLLYTMLEQLTIRIQKNLLSDAHLPIAFSSFLSRYLPAMRVSNRPTKILLALLEECRNLFTSSEFSSNPDLFSNLKRSSDLLTALTLGPSTEKVNGHVKDKAAKSTDGSNIHQFILNPSSESKIDWSLTSPIEAKMVFLSSLSKLLDGQTKLTSAVVIRQALENGANDRSYLQTFLFDNIQLLRSIVQSPERLSFLIDVITTSTFNSASELDREMMSNLIRLIVDDLSPRSPSLCQASARLASFMQTSDRQRVIDTLIQEEEYLEQVSGILALDQDTVLNDEVPQKIISKRNGTKNVEDILYLLQRSHKGANTNVEKLIDFTVKNLDEPLASTALRSLMIHYEASRPHAIQQLLTRPNKTISKYAAEAIAEAIGVNATNLPSDLAHDAIATVTSHIFSKDHAISTAMVRATVSLTRTFKDQVYTTLLSNIPEKPINVFKAEAVLLALHAAKNDDECPAAKKVVHAISEKILQWLVRRFAEDEEDGAETLEVIKALLVLIRFQSSLLKNLSHLVEPVLTAAIDRRLQSELHAELITSLFISTPLKSNIVQLFMDKMLHDRAALAVASIRENIVTAVTTYIEKDRTLASNALMTRLVSLYRGTLDLSDRQIFQSLAFYEQSHASVSMLSMLKEWNSSNEVSGSSEESLIYRLDANRVLDTIQHFPRARSYRDLKSAGYGQLSVKQTEPASLYDPLFLLSAYAQFLSGDRDPSGLQLVEMMRTNVLGATVCCLSSIDQSVRSSASLMVAKTYAFAKSAEFQEKEQLLLILDALRNSIKQAKLIDGDGVMSRPLPLTITMFVAHAIRALAQPTIYLYPLISRFLLQRATPLDPSDIPLLYGFLYASSYQTQTHKQQRLFILRFLTSAVRYGGQADWKIMRHRHVWQGICVLYTTSRSTGDTSLKRAIEEFWLSAMQQEHVVTYAILRIGFVEYLQQMVITIGTSNDQEKLFLLHLVCCMIQNGDLQKLRKATNNLWLSSICGLVTRLKVEKLMLSPDLAKELDHTVQKLSSFLLELSQIGGSASVLMESDLFRTMDLLSSILLDYFSMIEEQIPEMSHDDVFRSTLEHITQISQRTKSVLKLKSLMKECDGKIDKELLQRLN
ncbi:uncharacterized protein FA14DRAFT_171572 [Meira miltonrushii]|uniref:Nucleolar pre-ribosomal-associated protein 1 C-terminal domain-containing protein n=1 Tax=Meira miltonrushii TaxID=1280837 RepID=A0A316VBF4_9BASI|nr:uncharacterized protein FA14DRAFT_171572 [Meira miltonrushii]PWN34846.1 hypothetical protein FA14DRAFT_171572 [Meira miltonrushii]